MTSSFVTVNDFTIKDQTVRADAVKAMKSHSVTPKKPSQKPKEVTNVTTGIFSFTSVQGNT